MRSFTKHQVTWDKEHSSVCFGAKRKYLQVAVEKFFSYDVVTGYKRLYETSQYYEAMYRNTFAVLFVSL